MPGGKRGKEVKEEKTAAVSNHPIADQEKRVKDCCPLKG
jgi:hypothetical protein